MSYSNLTTIQQRNFSSQNQQQVFRYGNIDLSKKKAVVVPNNKDSIEKIFNSGFNGSIAELKVKLSELNIPFHYTKENGETLIHQILRIQSNLSEIQILNFIKYCILKGTPVDLHDDQGITPLHLASKYQYIKIVELLLEHGADPTSTDLQNMNAGHYAVQGKIIKNIGEKRVKNITENKNSKLINNLTNFIIKQLNSDNKYIMLIKNIFQNIYLIYEHDIDLLFNEFLLKLQGIIENKTTSEDEKKKQLQNEKKNIIDSLIYKITNDLSLTYQNIKINPNIFVNLHEFEFNDDLFLTEIYNEIKNKKNDKNDKNDKNKNEKNDKNDKKKQKNQKGGVIDTTRHNLKNILDQTNVNNEIIKYISDLEKHDELIKKDFVAFQNKTTEIKNELKITILESYKNIFSIYQIYTYMVYNSYYAFDDNYDLQILLKNINDTFRNITPIKKSYLLNLTDIINRREQLNNIRKKELEGINIYKAKILNIKINEKNNDEKKNINIVFDIDIYIDLFKNMSEYYFSLALEKTYKDIAPPAPGGKRRRMDYIFTNISTGIPPTGIPAGGIVVPIGGVLLNIYPMFPLNDAVENEIILKIKHFIFAPPIQNDNYIISEYFIFTLLFTILENECRNIKSIINKISKNNETLIKILTSKHIDNIKLLCGKNIFSYCLLGKSNEYIINSLNITISEVLKYSLEMFNTRNMEHHVLILKLYFSMVFDKINEESEHGFEVHNSTYGNSHIQLEIIDNHTIRRPLDRLANVKTAVDNGGNHPLVGGYIVDTGIINMNNKRVSNIRNSDGYIDYILTNFYKINNTNIKFDKLKKDLSDTIMENDLINMYKKFFSLEQINLFFNSNDINHVRNTIVEIFYNVGIDIPTNKKFNIIILHYLIIYSTSRKLNSNIISTYNTESEIKRIFFDKYPINMTIFDEIFFENTYGTLKKCLKINSHLNSFIIGLAGINLNLNTLGIDNIKNINNYELLKTEIDETYSQKFILQYILRTILLSIEYEKKIPFVPNDIFINNINNNNIQYISFQTTLCCFIFDEIMTSCNIIPDVLPPANISSEIMNEIDKLRNNVNLYANIIQFITINYIHELLYIISQNSKFNTIINFINKKIITINNTIFPNIQPIIAPIGPVPLTNYRKSIENMIDKYQDLIINTTNNIDKLTPLKYKLEKIINEIIKIKIIEEKYKIIINNIINDNILFSINSFFVSYIYKIINDGSTKCNTNIYYAKNNARLVIGGAPVVELFNLPINLQTSIKLMSIMSKTSIIPLTLSNLYLNIDLSYDIINIITENIDEIKNLFSLTNEENNVMNIFEILTKIYYHILDTIQYMLYLKKNEHVEIKKNLEKLLLKISNDEKNIKNEMYFIVLLNIKNYISNIIKNINDIDELFQKTYKELYNMTLILNKKITSINKTGGLHFLGFHIKNNINLNKKIPKLYENIFAKILPLLKLLPSDFSSFMSNFINTNHNDKKIIEILNGYNKQMYDEFSIYISEKNCNYYLSNINEKKEWIKGYYIPNFDNSQKILNLLKEKQEKNFTIKKELIPYPVTVLNDSMVQSGGMYYNSGRFGIFKMNESSFLYETSRFTIDIFLNYLKNKIINILNTNDISYDEILSNISNNIIIHEDFREYIVSILFYNKSNDIISTFIKNLVHSSSTKIINELLMRNTKFNLEINNHLLSDINYEFDLSKTYYELQNEYMNYIEQSFQKNMVNNNHFKKNIIYESYSFFEDNSSTQYFYVNDSVIDLLMDVGCRFDTCDNSDLSPIFYSIDMLDINTVEKIITSNCYFKEKSILVGARAFDFACEMFHDFIENNNMISPIEYENSSGIIKEISLRKHIYIFKTDDFYNNILLSLDQSILDVGLPMCVENIFDMIIFLYNHQFYLHAKYNDFINSGWTKNNYNILIALFINNNFNINDIGFDNPILNYFDHNISYNEIYTDNSYIDLLKNQIHDLQTQINIINKNKAKEQNITNNENINSINKKIKMLKKKLEKININKFNIDINNTKFIDKNNKIFNIFDIDKLYDTFIYKTMDNKSTRYNKLWKKYIQSNKNSKKLNISNIINCFINFGYNFKTISKNNTNIVLCYYNSIVVYLLNELRTKSLHYNSNNILLTNIMNIMAHVTKHILCSKLYSSIIQIFVDDMKNKSNYEYLNIFKNFIEQNELKELEIFIMENLPIKLVKFYLNIYEQHEVKIDEIDKYIIENITYMLTQLNYEQENEILNKNITTIIGHYIAIFNIFIPKMKNIIDDYNCYLMNYYKHLKILELLN